MSRFLSDSSDYNADGESEIDFESAVLLPCQGSACEVYKIRWQRRTVLVKRLKEEFRDSPLHLDALEKEYEIGVSLKYPGIPTYLAFGRNYIIMEYIDGQTLASMLESHDSLFRNEKNVILLLQNLINTIDYLHRHNVVHCDIKPDNIILTANGYNPILLDFDKCYTDAFNDTSGHPDRFGLPADIPGRMLMDFRGLANVAESITAKYPTVGTKKIKRFIEKARQLEATPDILKESLEAKPTRGMLSLSFLALGIIVLVALIIGFLFLGDREKNIDMESSEKMLPQTIGDTITPSQSSSPSPSPSVIEAVVPLSESKVVLETQEQLHQEARERAAVLDRLIAPRYQALSARLDRLIKLKSTDIPGEQLLDSIRAYADFEEECFQEIGAMMRETIPPMSPREETRILAYSKVYTDYNRRSAPELAEINRIIREKMGR